MLKKVYKIICAIVIINSFVCGASTSNDVPIFSEADWQGAPTMPKFTFDDILEMFVAPLSKDGKLWEISRFDNDKFTSIIKDHQFEVRTLSPDEEDCFDHTPFCVDANNFVQFELFLVSTTKSYEVQSCDEEEFMQSAPLPIMRKLTEDEKNNKIVAHLRSSLTFEAQSNLYRLDPVDYKNIIGRLNAFNIIIFVKEYFKEEFVSEYNDASTADCSL